MDSIEHFFINAAISVALTGAAFVAVNLAFAVSGRGNLQAIKAAYVIRKALHGMPGGTVLQCRERRVSALVYDRERDMDVMVPLYTSPRFSSLAWETGPRSARSLYGNADSALALAVGALVLAFFPFLAIGMYLAVSVSWLWWFAVFTLLGAEVVMTMTNKLFYLKWRAFSPLIPTIFLHRYGLYSLSIACMIIFGLVLISMVITVWVESSS